MSTPLSSARILPTSTQVTASVVKFRCLYTHDLRRKSKRWHDGYLRYHKFNKRVMVYDDQGNFIGDHHWRSHEEVQDGDEMELDKGVLIEVCENMGTIETDISNLYEKKRSSQSSPQNKQSMHQTPRASAAVSTPRVAGSSQSFRSLNDLLGIKKNPAGNLASPYEKRNVLQPAARAEEPDRAPKRQKTAMLNQPGDNGPRTQNTFIDLTDSAPGDPTSQMTKGLGKQTTKVTKNPPAEPPTNRQPRPVLSKSKSPHGPDPSLSSDISPTSFQPSSNPPTPESLISSPSKPVPLVRPPINTSQNPPPIRSQRPLEIEATKLGGYVSLDKQLNEHGNGLQTGPLNQHIPQTSVPPTMRSPLPTTTNASVGQLPPSQPYVDPSWHQVDQSDNTQPPARPRKAIPPVPRNSLSTTTQPLVTRPTVDNSVCPMVSHNAQSLQATITPAPNKMPPPPRPLPAKPPETPSGGLRMSTGKPRNKLIYSALLPGGSRMLSRATLDSSSKSDNDGLAPNPQVPAKPTDPVDPARSTAHDEFMPSSSTQFILDETLDGSGVNPSAARAPSRKRSLDSPLRKSLSDPSALAGFQPPVENPLSSKCSTDEPMEQGAWTSEALDLFDFWPAGRPKPSERNGYSQL